MRARIERYLQLFSKWRIERWLPSSDGSRNSGYLIWKHSHLKDDRGLSIGRVTRMMPPQFRQGHAPRLLVANSSASNRDAVARKGLRILEPARPAGRRGPEGE